MPWQQLSSFWQQQIVEEEQDIFENFIPRNIWIIMNSHRTRNHQESVSLHREKKKFRFLLRHHRCLFDNSRNEWVMVWNRLTVQRNVSKIHAKDFNSFWHGVNTWKFIYFVINTMTMIMTCNKYRKNWTVENSKLLWKIHWTFIVLNPIQMAVNSECKDETWNFNHMKPMLKLFVQNQEKFSCLFIPFHRFHLSSFLIV